MLQHDTPESTLPYIAELLEAGIRVIAYNGDRDLSTCAQGTELLLNRMNWTGHEDWFTAPRGLWTVGTEPAGYAKSLKGLDFVVVYNSGHLVPYNQPAHALDLITRFLRGDSFLDHALPSFDFGYQSKAKEDASSSAVIEEQEQEQEASQPIDSTVVAMIGALLVAFAAGFGAASIVWKRKPGYSQL